VADNIDEVVSAFTREFPDITPEAIVRQVRDAVESVALFGIPAGDSRELVDRLVRSHLEALTALRSQS
jgi:hypothetical protein